MPAREFSTLEQKIITLIFREFTSQEIADKLGYSIRTIETQRLYLLKKMKVTNVVGMVKYAIRHGLVDFPVPAKKNK
jgi:two-component system invasion response regulator UvrY